MLDEVTKALAPWPILQFCFGAFILGIGIWALIKGTQKAKEPATLSPPSLDAARAEWKAYQELENLEKNSFEMLDLLKKIANNTGASARQLEHLNEALRQLTAALWSNRPPPPLR